MPNIITMLGIFFTVRKELISPLVYPKFPLLEVINQEGFSSFSLLGMRHSLTKQGFVKEIPPFPHLYVMEKRERHKTNNVRL